MTAEFIQQTLAKINQSIWHEDLSKAPVWKSVFIRSVQIIYAVLRDLKDGQLSMRAMSLVYTTVIAIVPFIALIFSVLKGFGLHNEVEPLLLDSLEALGDKRFEIVDKVLQFVDNVKVGVLGAVGFALLIYSVIAMMHKIERSFNYTWQIKRDRTLSQRFRDYLSVIFVGPLLILLSVAITTSVNTEAAVSFIELIPFGASVVEFFSRLIPYLIMSLGFAFIYLFLPNTSVRLLAAFVGGLVTAVCWKVMGWGVTQFVANSASNIAIYSAFASVIILMVWMYLGWLVLLVGASVAFYFQNPQYILIRRDAMQLSGENQERLALHIFYLVGLHFKQSLPPWNVDSLAKALRVAPHWVDDMVEFLVAEGFLIKAGENDTKIIPKRSLESIKLQEVLVKIRCHGLHATQALVEIPSRPAPVVQLFGDLRSAVDSAINERTVADLFEDDKL